MRCPSCDAWDFAIFRPVYEFFVRRGFLRWVLGAVGRTRTGWVVVCSVCARQYVATEHELKPVRPMAVRSTGEAPVDAPPAAAPGEEEKPRERFTGIDRDQRIRRRR